MAIQFTLETTFSSSMRATAAMSAILCLFTTSTMTLHTVSSWHLKDGQLGARVLVINTFVSDRYQQSIVNAAGGGPPTYFPYYVSEEDRGEKEILGTSYDNLDCELAMPLSYRQKRSRVRPSTKFQLASTWRMFKRRRAVSQILCTVHTYTIS